MLCINSPGLAYHENSLLLVLTLTLLVLIELSHHILSYFGHVPNYLEVKETFLTFNET